MLNADATGLAILLLLALGTFVAGVHSLFWQTCVLGLVLRFEPVNGRGLLGLLPAAFIIVHNSINRVGKRD
jgi:hypothetical protein